MITADGINFPWHYSGRSFIKAVKAAQAATLAANQGFPSYAAIYDAAEHTIVAIVSEANVYVLVRTALVV